MESNATRSSARAVSENTLFSLSESVDLIVYVYSKVTDTFVADKRFENSVLMLVVDFSGYIRGKGNDIFVGGVSHAVEQVLAGHDAPVTLRIVIVYLLYSSIEVVSCDIAHLHNYSLSLVKSESRGCEETFIESIESCDRVLVFFVDQAHPLRLNADPFKHLVKGSSSTAGMSLKHPWMLATPPELSVHDQNSSL